MAHLACPNLGNYTIVLASFIDLLGLEAWASTATTPAAMKLGIQHAPESVCLPFKAHLGNYIEAAEAGVEYSMMVNSIGTCRLRYYRAMAERILKEKGYNMRMFGLGFDGIKPPLIRYFDPPLIPSLKYLKAAYMKMKIIDIIEIATWRTRAREIEQGRTSIVMNKCLKELNEIRYGKKLKLFKNEVKRRFSEIPVRTDKQPLRIGLIGEVSVLRDKTLNHNIEEILGCFGVETRNFFILGPEVTNIFNLNFGNKYTRKNLMKIARPYLDCPVGGHALDSVAHTLLCVQEGYDGMIHLCPSGCMPEISIRPILRRISHDKDIPVLQCSFDEHTSAVGLITRLEAFIDVLNTRRNKKSISY